MPATVDEQSDTNPIAKLSEEIDSLLAKYLELLDKYTSQRAALSETFNSLSQNLARANFHSKSGHRYGSDSYDQRMQATRTVAVTHLKPESSTDTGGVAVYTVSTGSHEKPGHAASEASGSRNTTLHAEGGTNSKATVAADTNENQAEEKDSHNDEAKKTMKKDPLLMFGIFSPPELKAAQVNAVGMVEDVIPQLLTVNEQMKDLEIKIRRAKKYRAREQAKEDALELARAKVFIKTAARNDLDEFDTEEHARLMIARRIKITNTENVLLVESEAEIQALYELNHSKTSKKISYDEKVKLPLEYVGVCSKNVALLKVYEDEKEELTHLTNNFLADRTPLPPWDTKIGRLDLPQIIVKVEPESLAKIGLVRSEFLVDNFQTMPRTEEGESNEILDESTSEEDIPGFLNDQLKAIVKDQAENQGFLDEQLLPPDQAPVVKFAKIPNNDHYSVNMQNVEVPLPDRIFEKSVVGITTGQD